MRCETTVIQLSWAVLWWALATSTRHNSIQTRPEQRISRSRTCGTTCTSWCCHTRSKTTRPSFDTHVFATTMHHPLDKRKWGCAPYTPMRSETRQTACSLESDACNGAARVKAAQLPDSTWLMFARFSHFCFLCCAWSRRRPVTSASPTDCATSTAWMSGGLNRSLCKQGQLLHSDKKERRRPKQRFNSSFPAFSGKLQASFPLLFSHHILLRTVADLPGWESTFFLRKKRNSEQIVHKTETQGTSKKSTHS